MWNQTARHNETLAWVKQLVVLYVFEVSEQDVNN